MASFPSSYIPTQAASATRAADVLAVPVSGIDYPLSLFAEFERAVDTGASEVLLQIDAGAGGDHRAVIYIESDDTLKGIVRAASTTMNSGPAGATAIATTYKSALRVAANDALAARSGSLGTRDTTVTVPNTPTTVRFGTDTSSPSFGYLRRAALFTRALSDAELQALTA